MNWLSSIFGSVFGWMSAKQKVANTQAQDQEVIDSRPNEQIFENTAAMQTGSAYLAGWIAIAGYATVFRYVYNDDLIPLLQSFGLHVHGYCAPDPTQILMSLLGLAGAHAGTHVVKHLTRGQ